MDAGDSGPWHFLLAPGPSGRGPRCASRAVRTCIYRPTSSGRPSEPEVMEDRKPPTGGWTCPTQPFTRSVGSHDFGVQCDHQAASQAQAELEVSTPRPRRRHPLLPHRPGQPGRARVGGRRRRLDLARRPAGGRRRRLQPGSACGPSAASASASGSWPIAWARCQRAGTARDQGLVVVRGASVPPVGLVVVTVSVWTVVLCSVVV